MLDHIITSKVRRKILALFFHDITEKYYVRQIERKIGEEVNAVKRELDILQEAKVLQREKRLNKVFYGLNFHFFYFDEFLRMFSKESPLSELLMKNISRIGKVKYVAISMKFPKKLPLREDEIYALFIGVIVIPEVELLMNKARKLYDRDINYTVMTEDELAFRKKNNDPFIWKFLRQPKIMLVGQEEDLLA
ncbi:winged helix-turn-helix transcriptional regulator [Candidatus Woesebacteria bacterium]|nr:winged helix-turn-helix transcriptional regulator [Candidatus Woesebacteria bacterium]